MDVSQYLEIFIDETNGHLQTLSDNIMQLEKEPENKDVINEIFRAAHSLKGMAGTMGFKRMQRLTHDMENVFQEIRSDKMKVTSSLIELEGEGLSLAHDGGSAGRHRQTAGDHRPLAYPQDRTGVKRHHRPAGGLD